MAIGLKELIAEARRNAREVPPEEAHRLAGEGALVLDVRESGEFRKGHIAGSRNVSRGLLELRAAEDSPGADSELVARRSAPVGVYSTK